MYPVPIGSCAGGKGYLSIFVDYNSGFYSIGICKDAQVSGKRVGFPYCFIFPDNPDIAAFTICPQLNVPARVDTAVYGTAGLVKFTRV